MRPRPAAPALPARLFCTRSWGSRSRAAPRSSTSHALLRTARISFYPVPAICKKQILPDNFSAPLGFAKVMVAVFFQSSSAISSSVSASCIAWRKAPKFQRPCETFPKFKRISAASRSAHIRRNPGDSSPWRRVRRAIMCFSGLAFLLLALQPGKARCAVSSSLMPRRISTRAAFRHIAPHKHLVGFGMLVTRMGQFEARSPSLVKSKALGKIPAVQRDRAGSPAVRAAQNPYHAGGAPRGSFTVLTTPWRAC